MGWLTIGELRRVLSEAGVPVSEKTVRTWVRVAGLSRLIANRRMFDARIPHLLLAGHDLRDIGAALRDGASPQQLALLPPGSSRRGNPLKQRLADNEAA